MSTEGTACLCFIFLFVSVSQTEKNIIGITKIFNILKLGFMNFKIAYGKSPHY